MRWSFSTPTVCSIATTRRCGCSASIRSSTRSACRCISSRRRPRRTVGRRPRSSPTEGERSSSRASSASIGDSSAPDGEDAPARRDPACRADGRRRNRARNPARRDGRAPRGAQARNCAVGGGKQPAAPVAAGCAHRTAQPCAVSGRGPAPDRRGASSRTVSACCTSMSTTSAGSTTFSERPSATARCARSANDCVTSSARADLLARLGSDEFALLLTDCSADAAAEIAAPPGCRAGTAAHGRRSAVQRHRQRRRCLSWRAGTEPREPAAAGGDGDERRRVRTGAAVGRCSPKR